VTDPKKPKRRSQAWFGIAGKSGFLYRSWLKNQGYPNDLFDGRPVIGICNTWSDLTPCNGHFRELAEFVKRGVYEAGGFPLEFPVMSLGETQLRPTAKLRFADDRPIRRSHAQRQVPRQGHRLRHGCVANV
jgi:dihydroxy-acid dehydratase